MNSHKCLRGVESHLQPQGSVGRDRGSLSRLDLRNRRALGSNERPYPASVHKLSSDWGTPAKRSASTCASALVHVRTHTCELADTQTHTHRTRIGVPERGKGKITGKTILRFCFFFRNAPTCFRINSKGAGEMAGWVKPHKSGELSWTRQTSREVEGEQELLTCELWHARACALANTILKKM